DYLQSQTFLLGEQGDEIADHTLNRRSEGKNRSEAIFIYDGNKSAADADLESALRRQVTFRYKAGVKDYLQSQTFLLGEQGDEIADHTLNLRRDGKTRS